MNKHALLHKSDSLYSYAVSEDTVELRLRAARGDLKSVDVVYGSKHKFYLQRESAPAALAASDELYDYFAVRLKLTDKRLAYIFVLTDNDGRKYYFSEDGAVDDYDFSLAYYNFFQLAYVNPNDVMPKVDWLSDAVVYQIFVDRFNRGTGGGGQSSKSAAGAGYINLKWGDAPTPKSFAGGDLDGIREKLDYIEGLGANTLYLTPIFTSRSNHKYDISDYYNVDPHFGGNAAFARLMDACKKRGIRVILDAVFNHCSEDIAFFRDVKQKGRASEYHDYFVIAGDKPTKAPVNYETFGECDYMPKWNTANPKVAEYLCGVGEYWIKEYGIDGWRLDVSDEVSHGFWQMFRKRIKALGDDKVLIGENWHDSRSYLRGDQFDSIMNYAFTKAILDYFVYGTLDAKGLCARLNGLMMRNTAQVNDMMLNLIDCHDTHRFYTLCGESEQKLLSALALNLFMPGATMMYYGTEIPLVGGYDPDNRRCFDWGGHPFTDKVRALLAHKKLDAFHGGDVKFDSDGDAFIMRRSAHGSTATLYVNNTDRRISANGIDIEPFGHKITVE